MTTLRLAVVSGRAAKTGFIDPAVLPHLLVSYAYWKPFTASRSFMHFKNYSLDSGAFTAWQSGKPVDLKEYTEFARERLLTDKQCAEVFALDVIGDEKQSLKNYERMWAEGVQAIPIFHLGSSEQTLLYLAKTYPKIALGGAATASEKVRMEWVKWAFKKVWPAKIHGLALSGERMLMTVPFHSVDASSWEVPGRFGTWKKYGHASIRGSNQPMSLEVDWYLELERRVQFRWRNVLREAFPEDYPQEAQQ